MKALLKNTPAKKVKHLKSHIDRAEAERLVDTYSDLILRLSYTYLKSTEDAKDICQTVFLRLLEKPRSFETPEHERAWIIRAAVNLCKDQLKSHWRKTTVDLEAARAVPAPEAEEGSLLAAVNLLPPSTGRSSICTTTRGIPPTRLPSCWGEAGHRGHPAQPGQREAAHTPGTGGICMKTYRQSLDELHFTREEKNAMVDRLTAGESRGGGKIRSIRRTVTVGVAAALLMTMGVGAAVTLTPAGEVFASIFGNSPAQTEIMDRMGVPIGASDTADGVTITADAIIGDTYSYSVVYSIARDDGQPLRRRS